jgi:hypothetical protein
LPSTPKRIADYMRLQKASGYDIEQVTVDGHEVLAERFRDNVMPWDGLDLVGQWHDDSCGDDPQQHWTEGSFRGHAVIVYIRWRGDDPWTGFVVKVPPGVSGKFAFFYKYPWSPNLLPTDQPEPPGAPRKSLLALISEPQRDPWIPRDEESHAKTVIVERADLWLCKNVDWLTKKEP